MEPIIYKVSTRKLVSNRLFVLYYAKIGKRVRMFIGHIFGRFYHLQFNIG